MTQEKPTVLIVDDNESTCVLLTAILKSRYTVDVSSNGDEAVAKLKTRRYAVVLLDLLMPGSDGFTVLTHLRELQPAALPTVIVLTASLTPAQLERVAQFNVHCVIRKPFDVEHLLRTVTDCAGMPPSGPTLLNAGPLVLMLVAEFLKSR